MIHLLLIRLVMKTSYLLNRSLPSGHSQLLLDRQNVDIRIGGFVGGIQTDCHEIRNNLC
jgi:hypothetical protein